MASAKFRLYQTLIDPITEVDIMTAAAMYGIDESNLDVAKTVLVSQRVLERVNLIPQLRDIMTAVVAFATAHGEAMANRHPFIKYLRMTLDDVPEVPVSVHVLRIALDITGRVLTNDAYKLPISEEIARQAYEMSTGKSPSAFHYIRHIMDSVVHDERFPEPDDIDEKDANNRERRRAKAHAKRG